MELISKNEFKELVNFNRLGKDIFTDIIFKVLKLNKLNKLYDNHCEKTPHEFIDGIISELGINYEILQSDLERIPKEGAFIIISNHPFGALDGILLYKMLFSKLPYMEELSELLDDSSYYYGNLKCFHHSYKFLSKHRLGEGFTPSL